MKKLSQGVDEHANSTERTSKDGDSYLLRNLQPFTELESLLLFSVPANGPDPEPVEIRPYHRILFL